MSGSLSNDFRDLEQAQAEARTAKLALDVLAYRVVKYIGAYACAMGLDVIVFTPESEKLS